MTNWTYRESAPSNFHSLETFSAISRLYLDHYKLLFYSCFSVQMIQSFSHFPQYVDLIPRDLITEMAYFSDACVHEWIECLLLRYQGPWTVVSLAFRLFVNYKMVAFLFCSYDKILIHYNLLEHSLTLLWTLLGRLVNSMDLSRVQHTERANKQEAGVNHTIHD